MASKKPPVPEGISLTKQRSYMSEITVSLGLLHVPCDFMPAKATDNSVKFKVVCPHDDHGKEAVAPAQRYICEGNSAEDMIRRVLADASLTKAADLRAAVEKALLAVHGPYSSAEAARAREVDKVLHKVTPEEIAAAKKGDETPTDIIEGQMALVSSPRQQVQAQVLPSGTVYRLRPRNGAFDSYTVLMDAIEETYAGYQVYGEVIARGDQKLFLLSVFTDAEGNRQIIAQESLRPGDMAELDKVVTAYPESYLSMATEIITDRVCVDFEADSYVNQRKLRAAEMDERLRNEGGGTVLASQAARAENPANGSNNLMAALEASLATTKPKAKKAS